MKESSARGFAKRVQGNVTNVKHQDTCDANYVVHYKSRTQKNEPILDDNFDYNQFT